MENSHFVLELKVGRYFMYAQIIISSHLCLIAIQSFCEVVLHFFWNYIYLYYLYMILLVFSFHIFFCRFVYMHVFIIKAYMKYLPKGVCKTVVGGKSHISEGGDARRTFEGSKLEILYLLGFLRGFQTLRIKVVIF